MSRGRGMLGQRFCYTSHFRALNVGIFRSFHGLPESEWPFGAGPVKPNLDRPCEWLVESILHPRQYALYMVIFRLWNHNIGCWYYREIPIVAENFHQISKHWTEAKSGRFLVCLFYFYFYFLAKDHWICSCMKTWRLWKFTL